MWSKNILKSFCQYFEIKHTIEFEVLTRESRLAGLKSFDTKFNIFLSVKFKLYLKLLGAKSSHDWDKN